MLELSVHICTFDPRPAHLERTLEALQQQTLPRVRWELLLVDNASTTEVARRADLSWHPQARYLREDQLGKTHALLLAIREAQADLLVTVDDDNVLAPDYLQHCCQIASEFPKLGAWGGQIMPEFETNPPEWAKPHLHNLALYQADRDVWTNLPRAEFLPPGAGMCFRRVVGRRYAELVRADPRRAGLDRQGELMIGCGDTDLALTAVDIGFGTGRFVRLRLTHLIPSERVQEQSLLDLIERTAYSFTRLHDIRPETRAVPVVGQEAGWRGRIHQRLARLQTALLPRETRLVREASLRGVRKAAGELSRQSRAEPR
jgi:glycosyltransferase involved in cell wall biosynthesis